jgi:hypothetical protein
MYLLFYLKKYQSKDQPSIEKALGSKHMLLY